MYKLVPSADRMRVTVTEQEAQAFDPTLGPCCDSTGFRVHLEGTTCDPWNKSATTVFVNSFLVAHPEYSSRDESVREMVLMKSKATLDSMIRSYRKYRAPRTADELEAQRLHKNRQERKRKVGSVIPCATR